MNEKKEIKINHPHWNWLINICEKRYRFGKITIIIQDGIPQRIEAAIYSEVPGDEFKNE
jgi:hypothetical protein